MCQQLAQNEFSTIVSLHLVIFFKSCILVYIVLVLAQGRHIDVAVVVVVAIIAAAVVVASIEMGRKRDSFS